MFCPKCGNANQLPETYCRKCGNFLHDYSKPAKKTNTPEQHVKINTIFGVLTAVISLVLTILLYGLFLGNEDTPPIIYITAAFLTVIFAWQVQTVWRNVLLRKYLKKRSDGSSEFSNEPQEVSQISNQ